MSWKNTDYIIDKLLNDAKSNLNDNLENYWKKMNESRYAQIITYKNGELILKVNNSASLQLLSIKREEIKNNINKSIGTKIRKIRFRLGG